MFIFFLSFLTQGRVRAGERIQIVDSWDSALSAVLQTHVFYFSLASLLPLTPSLFPEFVPVPLPLYLS